MNTILCVDELQVERIIHDITSISDNFLITYLKKNNIPPDIRILSNYSTGA